MKTKTTWLFKYWWKNNNYGEKHFSNKKRMMKFILSLDWDLIESHIIKKVRFMSISKKGTISYQELHVTSKNKIKEWLELTEKRKGNKYENP